MIMFVFILFGLKMNNEIVNNALVYYFLTYFYPMFSVFPDPFGFASTYSSHSLAL